MKSGNLDFCYPPACSRTVLQTTWRRLHESSRSGCNRPEAALDQKNETTTPDQGQHRAAMRGFASTALVINAARNPQTPSTFGWHPAFSEWHDSRCRAPVVFCGFFHRLRPSRRCNLAAAMGMRKSVNGRDVSLCSGFKRSTSVLIQRLIDRWHCCFDRIKFPLWAQCSRSVHSHTAVARR